MESNLKSNEVRIPKQKGGNGGQNLFSKSFTSLRLINNGKYLNNKNNKIKNNGSNNVDRNSFKINNNNVNNEINNDKFIFDFNNEPSQYFKSSFARSLSTESATKSLDFNINFGLNDNFLEHDEQHNELSLSSLLMLPLSVQPSPPPPLPLTKPPNLITIFKQNKFIDDNSSSMPNCNNNKNNIVSNNNNNNNNKTENSSASNLFIKNNRSNSINSVWSTSSRKQNHNRKSLDSSEIELLRLRKECQTLIEENRRLMTLTSVDQSNGVIPNNSSNIEAVILQTKVDTLQWQLKQVEASRQMYRAVMTEVVKFLERCHRGLNSIQSDETMLRSKSIHQVYQNDATSLLDLDVSPRARSSTNIIDAHKTTGKLNCSTNSDESNPSPASTYSNFRDFTWRRSPKKSPAAQSIDSETAKLAQEAFRLLRTTQNLLNTQEPDLAQCIKNLQNDENFSIPPKIFRDESSLNNVCQKTEQIVKSGNQLNDFYGTSNFSRDTQSRESHLSLRSSTDSSVHSTSSSTKTDDDSMIAITTGIRKIHTFAPSTTEDESGFSSISSFQEIGLPLHSTMISINNTSSSNNSDSSSDLNVNTILDIKNSTLKAAVNGVGLPTIVNHHRRWDSAPAVPPRNHRLSTASNDDNTNVLWV